VERLKAIARAGADFVSMGAITHSAPAIDISFEVTKA
jgi:nicotinate-nucleotide pyrophosphorylase (carboxylating)